MNKEETIIFAIKNKKVIKFDYKEEKRITEPFVLGYHKSTNNLILRAYFIEGHSSSGKYNAWKLYTVENMLNIDFTNDVFSGDREHYNPEDSAMSDIIIAI